MSLHAVVIHDPDEQLWEGSDDREYLKTGRLYRRRCESSEGGAKTIYIVTCVMLSTLSRGKRVQLAPARQALIDFETGSLWCHLETEDQASLYEDVTEKLGND